MLRYIVSVLMGLFTWWILALLIFFFAASMPNDLNAVVILYGLLFAAAVAVGFVSALVAIKHKTVIAVITMLLAYLPMMLASSKRVIMVDKISFGGTLMLLLFGALIYVMMAVVGSHLAKLLLTVKRKQ